MWMLELTVFRNGPHYFALSHTAAFTFPSPGVGLCYIINQRAARVPAFSIISFHQIQFYDFNYSRNIAYSIAVNELLMTPVQQCVEQITNQFSVNKVKL